MVLPLDCGLHGCGNGPDEDLKWFLEIVAHIVDVAEDGESFTFKPNAKKKYFHRQYYAFLDKARELTGISIEAFCAETLTTLAWPCIS